MEKLSFQMDFKHLRLMNVFGSMALFLMVCNVHTFNIDVRNVKVLKGPKGTHFGYTLAFDEKAQEQNTTRLLVGAPMETTVNVGDDVQSGTVHICGYDGDVPQCSKNTLYDIPDFSLESKQTDGEGFGTSLSVSKSGQVVMCAPFWKDSAHEKKNYTFVPGRCVMSDNNRFKTLAPYYRPGKKSTDYLPPDSKEYYYGLATYGFSLDSTQESTFAFGSPGLSIFEGGVYISDMPRSGDFKEATTIKQFKGTIGPLAYGYLGYAVKFGKFCKGNKKYINLAAGAPNLKTVGAVYIYKWVDKDELFEYQVIEGDQAWSYFGSVLCAVDANNDNIDELLIGAPYHSDSNRESFDSGKVYVYTRAAGKKYYKQHLILGGSGNKNSMFGSAMQALGDFSHDTYPDVVIGAPGEEDGTGCIYLYLGSKNGLSPKYSQRICANEIPVHGKTLKRFGSTISGSTRLSTSHYPVFAVSSFLTDTVLMFTSRLIVRASAVLEAMPNPLDLSKQCDYNKDFEPCTVLKICFQQTFQTQLSQKLDFSVRLELDTQRRTGSKQRVEILDPKQKFRDSLGEISVKDVGAEKMSCQEFVIATKKVPISKDRFTPIQIKVTMELDEGAVPKHLDPLLDPTVPNTFTEMISITNDCSDNICNVDLSVDGEISYSPKKEYPFVVIGLTKELSIDLTITNKQEISYGTKLRIKLSQPLVYLRFQSTAIIQCKTKPSTSGAITESVVICNYYNSLPTNSSIEVSIIFNAKDVAMDKRMIKITATAMPIDEVNSPEEHTDDNKIVLKTPVYIVADVNVYGSSSPSEVTLKKANRLSLTSQEKVTRNFTRVTEGISPQILNHKFQIKNSGPSFLPKTNVFLSIPAYLPDASQLLSDVSVQLQFGEEEATECTDISSGFVGKEKINPTRPDIIISTTAGASVIITDSTRPNLVTGPETTTEFTFVGGINKRRRRDAEQDHSKTYFLTCQTSPNYCITFKCQLGSDVPSGGHAELNVTLTVDKMNVPIPVDYSSFYLQLLTIVQEPDHLLFKPWSDEGREQTLKRTSTIFHLIESGGKVAIWIIILSVILGLLLILLIAFICWKIGFFKRKKHHEVEEWKRKSMRMSRIPPAAAKAEAN